MSRVHDYNPLEQSFICIAAGATHGPLPSSEGVDTEEMLAAFGA